MPVKIQELNPKTGKVEHVHTFPSKGALEFHLRCEGLILKEAAIFNEACDNGEIFICGLKYHLSLEKLLEEFDLESNRAWKALNTIKLSKESFDVVQKLIDEPPEPSEKLRELMRSKPRYIK